MITNNTNYFSACPKCHVTYEGLVLTAKAEVTFTFVVDSTTGALICEDQIASVPYPNGSTKVKCNNCDYEAQVAAFLIQKIPADTALDVVRQELAHRPDVYEALVQELESRNA